jgi:hypothetical protein
MNKCIQSTSECLKSFCLRHILREVCKNETILGLSAQTKKFSVDSFSNQSIFITCLNNVLHFKEEWVVELWGLASLVNDILKDSAHRNNRDTQVNCKPKWSTHLQYLWVISSAKTFGGLKNTIFGSLGHLLINY